MPGTIQVSVLDFMALQSSSSSSSLSPVSIKISMGKREYKTWDKGDFSFQLTTLRDNLIVTLQDAEGKEISRTVVETKLVIEKGNWDDIFPLQGGGHVHMKLQFLLSEEDRQRIQIMRESASRKKHNELLNSEVRSPVHATTGASNIASSLQSNHEVSDPDKSLLQNEVSQAGLIATIPSTVVNNGKSGSKDEQEIHSVQKQTNPNDTDRHKDTSSTTGPEKQIPLEKTPSKIRNMISAFECSADQDMRPKIRPTATKSQSSKTGVEVSSNFTLLIKSSARNYDHTGDMGQAPARTREREENVGFGTDVSKPASSQEMSQLEQLKGQSIRVKGTIMDMKNKIKIMDKVDIEEEKTNSKDIARASTGEKASVSRRMLKEKGTHPLVNWFSRRRTSGSNLLGQKNGKGFQPKELQNANSQDALGDEPHSSECYDAWIFPVGGKRLCITTGGKQTMDLMAGCCVEAKTQLVAKNAKEAKEDDKTHTRPRELNVEDSTDAETSRGPIGQVMRVAIMVGFATLVFFTRQRKPENSGDRVIRNDG